MASSCVPKQHRSDDSANESNFLSVVPCGILSVVSELECNAEVVAAEDADDVLELVLGR